jgi:glyoxylase-like metal-dependent hydrolase (beta-lactamase superfamily II)
MIVAGLRNVVIATVMAVALVSGAAAQDVKREITRIAGDLYRFQNNFHYSVFLITPDGALVTDPINAEAAAWLKAEIDKRFNKQVKFVVLSHDHADHSSGGEVFDDTAVIVAHENARAVILGEMRPTAVPEVTFPDRMTIHLGGKTIELIHVGRNHSNNMTVVRFPAERALYVVDFIPVRAVAFMDFPDAYIPDWIDSIRAVEAMDFDILIPGHGAIGAKSDATAFREYMSDLYAAVLAGAREGKSLDELKASIKLDKYQDWFKYEDWLPLNIEGMYNRIALHRRGN